MIFIKRGRPSKDKNEVLGNKYVVRMNDFEKDQLYFLAQKSDMSINSYLRELILADYRRYREEKISEAEANLWN